MPGTVAPSVFRIPISLVRSEEVNEANPNNPSQATNTHRMANKPAIWLILASDLYVFCNC
jgi:hypothetical protein